MLLCEFLLNLAVGLHTSDIAQKIIQSLAIVIPWEF
jgi:hypothetical protein